MQIRGADHAGRSRAALLLCRNPLARAAVPLLATALCLGAFGCGRSTAPPLPVSPASEISKQSVREAAAPETALLRRERILRAEIERWRGTPYCWGGQSLACADCSGFVRAVLGATLGVRLPRTTAELARSGRGIDVSRLRPGDLVFFRIPGKGRHVGLYLRAGEFAHASSSRGVRLSNLAERYWRKRYAGARRVR
ncbi:MAG: hypothetical protein GF330_13425 [Candidatus Eisenbacteria bacterium]|nr:hypothetical protein [Candidatus Eisenbacteria bacterium]